MRSKRIPPEEQYRLIVECRQSGLTDHQWNFLQLGKATAAKRLHGFTSGDRTQL